MTFNNLPNLTKENLMNSVQGLKNLEILTVNLRRKDVLTKEFIDHPGEKSLEFGRIRKFVEFGRIPSNFIKFD